VCLILFFPFLVQIHVTRLFGPIERWQHIKLKRPRLVLALKYYEIATGFNYLLLFHFFFFWLFHFDAIT
jgi:hypothetical protein